MSIPKQRHIQNRFIVFFIVVSLPPLIFLGLVASWSVTKTRTANVAELETQVVRAITDQTEKFIDESVKAIELHVPDRAVSDIAVAPEADRKTLLEQMMAASELANVQELTIVSVSGQEIQKLARPAFHSAPLQASPIANVDRFSIAVSEGRYFSPVYFLPDGTPMITLAARILNGSGFLIGVFTAEMKLSFVQEDIMRHVSLGNKGYVYVVNQDGKIIGHSRDKTRVGSVASLPIVASVLAGNVHTGLGADDRYRTTEGEPVFAAAQLVPGTHIGIIAEWPEQDALDVVRTIQKQIVIFVLSTFGLILLASIFLARQVTKPIDILRKGAAVIGGGKFEHRITLSRHDELGELADSFNEMAVQLKQLDELRTTQIRNEVLAGALKKEQELSRQKDVFISVMSHQLRTPLTSLQWSMEFLTGELGKPELAKYKDFINDGAEASKQVTMIVDDLLTVAELGIGYRVTSPELVDCAKLIRKIGIETASHAEEKKLAMTIDAPETPLLIEGSSLNLHKVFLNLLDNAITYTKEGSVAVHVKEESDHLEIVLADTGIGVPKTEQQDIFKEFFRAKNAIVGKNVGTGLGLFIVKTIIAGHGGTISFVSEENKGTTFTVTLPKKQKQEEKKEV